MTLFAGIVQLGKLRAVDPDQSKELRLLIENDSEQKITFEFRSTNAYIVALDVGAFEHKGIIECNEAITVVAGDPIIRENCSKNRSTDTETLHNEFLKNDRDILCQAKGVYCGIHYNIITRKLFLFTDKLGIRPLYYYKKSNTIVFSTVLHYLEELSFIDLQADFRGICEQIAFTFCIGEFTPYHHIKLLRSGEVIEIYQKNSKRRIYWHWDEIGISGDKYDTVVDSAYYAFRNAVDLRAGDEENAIAFLSGGLDSRCVTALVKSNVENLYTFNFYMEMSQDKELARLYSENLKSEHYAIFYEDLFYPNFSQLIAKAWKEVEGKIVNKPKYSQMIWSGDGGSVGAGHVYLKNEIISTLKGGNSMSSKDVAVLFNSFGRLRLPVHLFYGEQKDKAASILQGSIKAELEITNPVEPERKVYYFYMFNDQRRHLHTHFETIGRHKIELLLPFFDSVFLEKVVSLPIRKCLYHGFYMSWFDRFPPFTRKSPWQTYPGHIPCPLELPENLTYQWAKKSFLRKDEKNKRREDYRLILQILKENKSLSRYLNKKKIYMAMVLHKYNLRNYSRIVKVLKDLNQHPKLNNLL